MVSLQSLAMLLTLSTTGQVSGVGETALIQFTADWCQPCQAVKPTVQKLVAAGHPVRVVNVDRDRALAAQYRVSSIPCFVMVVDGVEVDRQLGPVGQARLEEMLAKIPPRQAGSSRHFGQSPDPSAAFPHAEASARPLPVTQPAGSWDGAGGSARSIQAAVRLKVEDANGHSYGTGTLIDARGGRALVLTCGHIFRDSAGKGRVTVDLVGLPGSPPHEGAVLSYDLKRDVGLVMITPTIPVVIAPVAPTGVRLEINDRVSSVGCNNGQAPTLQSSRVTGIDKYLGPPNVEVAGMPVEGRSGGGLFNEQGYVVGVCFAADPQDNEGVYAGLAAIHAELDLLGLSDVYAATRPAPSPETLVSQTAHPPAMPARMPGERLSPTDSARRADHWAPASDSVDSRYAANPTGFGANNLPASSQGSFHPADLAVGRQGDTLQSADPEQLNPNERAALAEIYARGQEAEVICIIRPLSDPQGKSEIIVIDRASPAFLQRLSGRQLPNPDRQLTSHAVPRGTSPQPRREHQTRYPDRDASADRAPQRGTRWTQPR